MEQLQIQLFLAEFHFGREIEGIQWHDPDIAVSMPGEPHQLSHRDEFASTGLPCRALQPRRSRIRSHDVAGCGEGTNGEQRQVATQVPKS